MVRLTWPASSKQHADLAAANERALVADDAVPWEAGWAPGMDVEPAAPARTPAWRAFAQVSPRRWLALRFGRAVADEDAFGTAFLFVPVLMGVGAVMWFAADDTPPVWGIGLAAACLLCLFALGPAKARGLFGVPLFLAVGALCAQVQTARIATPMMGGTVTTRITATLVHAERMTGGRSRLWLDITGTAQPELRFPPERVRVTARGDHAAQPAGSRVTGLVRLFPLPGPVQPGGYDFGFQSYFDGIGATGFFFGAPRFAPPDAPARWSQRIDRMRSALTARIADSVNGPNAAIVAALVTGVRGAIGADDNEALRRSGLAHVMSISGLHLALVCGAVLFSLRAALALFMGAASRIPAKKIAAGAAILVAAAYCLLSGGEVATLRSAIMIIVMLLAVLMDRPAVTMRNLAISAIIILAIWPHEIMGPSFQMSFAATAALVAGYRWHAKRQAAAERDLPQGRGPLRLAAGWLGAAIAAVIASSLLAGLATLAFGAFHFERVAPWGMMANLLAFPAVSWVVMPSLLLGVLAMPFGIDGWAWQVAAWGVDWMMGVAHLIAAWPGPDATGAVPVRSIVLFTLGFLLLVLPASGLRVLSVLPLAAAALFFWTAPQPVAMIAEDASLIGVVSADGALAVSTARPDAFLVADWSRVTQTRAVAAPRAGLAEESSRDAFLCEDDLCLMTMQGGTVIAHVQIHHVQPGLKQIDQGTQSPRSWPAPANPPSNDKADRHDNRQSAAYDSRRDVGREPRQAARTETDARNAPQRQAAVLARACAEADIVVLDATMEHARCARGTMIITTGMLARHGTAALMLDAGAEAARQRRTTGRNIRPPDSAKGIRLEWSFASLKRPWQRHRLFSRAARDLPERTALTPQQARERHPGLLLHR